MITEFDKSGIAVYYKRKFAECLEDGNFESALDYLIKFHDETHNVDFHLACGMLYLQLSLDSDDNELLCMAYREFMMHIRRFPDCTAAYRDMLAVLLLKRDGGAFIENCKWLKDRGIDFRAVMSDLAESGALFMTQEDDPPDFDGLFDGGYGTIDPAFDGSENNEPEMTNESPSTENNKASKIIKFAGGADGVPNGLFGLGERKNEVGPMSDGIKEPDRRSVEAFRDSAQDEGDDSFEDFLNAYIYGDEYDEADADEILNGISDADSDVGEMLDIEESVYSEPELSGSARVIRDAETAYERGDFEAALDELSRIKQGDGQYYFALTMRALINMELERFAAAEEILNEATELKPDGALGGALLCQLYEYEKKFDKIPNLLKQIDVKDYVNCAHLYKSFNMVMKYCNEEDAAELLNRYIDEFNIYEMRLVYAQLMYNMGEREYAIPELYKISRIFYDDVNARYFYLLARTGIEKFIIDSEVPQPVLGALVENFMAMIMSDGLPDEVIKNEVFIYGLEFFVTLEFKNDKKLLIKMFEALRRIARDKRLTEKVDDELVSPYVEPIVKATLLAELLASDPTRDFTVTEAFVPISSDLTKRLGGGYSAGYYIAYAFVVTMCSSRIVDLISISDRIEFSDNAGSEERDKAYYLFRTACAGDSVLKDDRLALAFGYKSKAAAARAFKETALQIIQK